MTEPDIKREKKTHYSHGFIIKLDDGTIMMVVNGENKVILKDDLKENKWGICFKRKINEYWF